MNITTSELVYINEAAKALKQKNFIIIDNAMIGLDNIQNILTYILLDSNFITNYFNGIVINQRSLSAFIKALSIESDFQFNPDNNIIRTNNGSELSIGFDRELAQLACDKFKHAMFLNETAQITILETEVQDIMLKIQNMNKADGSIFINYNNYHMTVFPSILPVNKSDKLYMTILQLYNEPYAFISKFRIKKKKFDVLTYVNYLKI